MLSSPPRILPVLHGDEDVPSSSTPKPQQALGCAGDRVMCLEWGQPQQNPFTPGPQGMPPRAGLQGKQELLQPCSDPREKEWEAP